VALAQDFERRGLQVEAGDDDTEVRGQVSIAAAVGMGSTDQINAATAPLVDRPAPAATPAFNRERSAFIGVHRRLTFFRYAGATWTPGKKEFQPPMNADERR
jgi:hypothetical protein